MTYYTTTALENNEFSLVLHPEDGGVEERTFVVLLIEKDQVTLNTWGGGGSGSSISSPDGMGERGTGPSLSLWDCPLGAEEKVLERVLQFIQAEKARMKKKLQSDLEWEEMEKAKEVSLASAKEESLAALALEEGLESLIGRDSTVEEKGDMYFDIYPFEDGSFVLSFSVMGREYKAISSKEEMEAHIEWAVNF